MALSLRTFVNRRLSAIGEIEVVSVDTAERTARVLLRLRGSAEPAEVLVKRYALDGDDRHDWLTLIDVAAEPEWLAASLRQFVVGRPLPIPHAAARALRLLAE